MNFRKKLFPILLLLLVCATRAHAQYHAYWMDRQEIATDYNTCMQGVKDSTGKWIIQPQYEYIETDHGRYIVSVGGKSGLLARNGTVMIPVQYDYMRSCASYSQGMMYNYFNVTLNDKCGIVDTANHIIVPVRYLRVTSYYDTSFVGRKTKRTYDFYNAQGTCFPCPWKSRRFPDHAATHLYVVQRWWFGRRSGLINDSGEIILKRKYSRIDAYDQTDIVKTERRSKYGFCSKAGTEIWPVVFSSPGHEWFDSDWAYLVGLQGTGPVELNGKTGLITAQGDTVLPFIYDVISPFAEDAPELWKVEAGRQSGIYDSKNRVWLLQPVCSEINSVASFRNEKDSSAVSLLVAKMNGNWGATTTAGQVVIPFECEDMLLHTTGQHVFLKGDSVLALSVTTLSQSYALGRIINPDNLQLLFWSEDSYQPAHSTIPADNRFPVFNGKDGVRCYYHPAFTKDSVLVDTVMRSTSTGNYYGMKIPDSILTSSCFSVIPLHHPLYGSESVSFYSFPEICDTDSSDHSTDFCLIRKNRKKNLTSFNTAKDPYYVTEDSDVLKNDGTLLISGDTIFSAEIRNHNNDGSVYFRITTRGGNFAVDSSGKAVHPVIRPNIEDFNGPYTWVFEWDVRHKNHSYHVIDNRTGLPLLGKNIYSEDVYPIWDSITIVNSYDYGVRIYNLNQQKNLTTAFLEIVPLRKDGSLFAVKTCSQKIGVVDAAGRTVLDTVYTAMTCVDRLEEIQTYNSVRNEFFRFFYTGIIFYNATDEILLDPVHKKIIPYNEAVPSIWRNAVLTHYKFPKVSDPSDSMDWFFTPHRMVSVCMSAEDSAHMQPWQIKCMADSIYTIKRYGTEVGFLHFHRCFYCKKTGGPLLSGAWSMYPPEDVRFRLTYRSDSLICFSRVKSSYYFDALSTKGTFSTVMLFKDGPRSLLLDSLFNPASDWKNFIINTLITYVNSHQYIEGDCHNPAGIPQMLKHDFEITPNGLALYPKGFEEKGNQLVLHIPWNELDPYLRKDIRSRLPITQH